MSFEAPAPRGDDRVSRGRYLREKMAREEAERMLEQRSRALFLANEELSRHSEILELAVQKRTEELRQALQRAETAKVAQSRFIATMSHEIRTPLGGLLGMIDLMRGEQTNEERAQLVDHAASSGRALRRIVNDVLDFSKMEAGAFTFLQETVDLRAIIEGVIAVAVNSQDGVAERLSCKIATDIPAQFIGDATRIRQVITNFVSNAVRYSADGPIVIRASRSGAEDNSTFKIEVEDQGVGLSEAEQSRLFKDFTQVANTLTAAAQGAGLGLAISKRIVEGLGGQIGVDSAPGIGSTFWFRMPIGALDTCQGAQRSHDASTSAAGEAVPPAETAGARVLLVEDNPINRKLFLAYFDRMKVDVTVAENGRIAIETFRPGLFDMIFMDVAMPVMDGLAATRHLRSSWSGEDLPPISFLTAHVLEAIRDECAAVQADLVISKPVTFEELRNAVQQLRGLACDASPQQSDVVEDTRSAAPPPVASLMSSEIAEGLVSNFPGPELEALVREYVQDGRAMLAVIQKACADEDTATMADRAHALKGSSSLLGFAAVAEFAALVESNADFLEQVDLDEIETCIVEHFREIEDLLPKAQ